MRAVSITPCQALGRCWMTFTVLTLISIGTIAQVCRTPKCWQMFDGYPFVSSVQFRNPFPTLTTLRSCFGTFNGYDDSPRSPRDVCKTRTSGISSGIVICAFAIFCPCWLLFALILSLLTPPYLAGITAIPNEPEYWHAGWRTLSFDYAKSRSLAGSHWRLPYSG